MLSSQIAVGWLEIRLPPGSAAALADQSGFTYHLAPVYGLTMCEPPVPVLLALGVGDEVALGVGELVCEGLLVGLPVTGVPLQAFPLRLNAAGIGLLPDQVPLNPKFVVPPVAMDPLYDRF